MIRKLPLFVSFAPLFYSRSYFCTHRQCLRRKAAFQAIIWTNWRFGSVQRTRLVRLIKYFIIFLYNFLFEFIVRQLLQKASIWLFDFEFWCVDNFFVFLNADFGGNFLRDFLQLDFHIVFAVGCFCFMISLESSSLYSFLLCGANQQLGGLESDSNQVISNEHRLISIICKISTPGKWSETSKSLIFCHA